MTNRDEFLKQLKRGIIIGDGAIGTELFARGAALEKGVERLNLSEPAIVEKLHSDYVAAGSNLIVTNTFSANPYNLVRYGLENELHGIIREGVRLARNAAGENVWVAGSIGPLPLVDGESLSVSDQRETFSDIAGIMIDCGVDVIMFETFLDISQLVCAVETVRRISSLPVIAQMAFEADGQPGGGGTVEAFVIGAREAGADVLGANCGAGVPAVRKAVKRLLPFGLPVSAYMNAGYAEKVEERNLYVAPDGYVADAAIELADMGVRIIGGCCGTSPETIHAISERIAKDAAVSTVSISRSISITEAPPAFEGAEVYQEPETPSGILVELDPPKKPDLTRIVDAAHALKESGVSAVTLADNPLASVRVDTLTVAGLIQRETGIPVIPHLTGRDRNRIALQATIMGAHVSGIRSLLCVTGDPVRMYNETNTSGVFDVTSIGLAKLVSEFNAGQRAGGVRTSFSVGVALNPNVRQLGGQIKKLKRKIEAGAHFALTQPVYTVEGFERLYEALSAEGIDLPIFAGIMPLISARNAEFLHNEVPGIAIPDEQREHLKSFAEVADQRKAGIAIAVDLVQKLAGKIHGLYLITPQNRAEYVLPVIEEGKRALSL